MDDINFAPVREAVETEEPENPLTVIVYDMGILQCSKVPRSSQYREVEQIGDEGDEFSEDSIEKVLYSDHEGKRDPKKRMRAEFILDEDEESSPYEKEEKHISIMARGIKLFETQIRFMVIKQ